jgi:hypothetical protein
MMTPPGLSFSPTQQSLGPGPDQQKGSGNPVQDAIKLLSFKLPTNVGQNAIAPNALIAGGPTALGGQSGSALIQNFLQSLLSGHQLAGLGAAGPTGAGGMGGNPFMNWMNQEPSPSMGMPGQTNPNLGVNLQFGGGQSQPGPSLTSPNIFGSQQAPPSPQGFSYSGPSGGAFTQSGGGGFGADKAAGGNFGR